jgi:L,D-transpeptidase YcbB
MTPLMRGATCALALCWAGATFAAEPGGVSAPTSRAATSLAPAKPANPALARSLAAAISTLPEPENDPVRKDRTALAAFYEARKFEPLWIADGALDAKAQALVAEIQNAGAYALDTSDFAVPQALPASATPDAQAKAELQLTLAALTYTRYARGGRIADPAAMLTTNIDRRPQWIDPTVVLGGLASADDEGAYLRGLEPKHVQFERLRQLYNAEIARSGTSRRLSPLAKHLRANMEMWRWMPDDMGSMYVFNNIPEFTQYVYHNGEVIRTERIVAGRVDMQSAIFSRPLKYVVLRPMWRVPDSIKVNELWPSLLRGGGYMRKYGLEVQTKDGDDVDWRKIDWARTDIRDYEVIQPPGPISVLGHVKFSFPSQHTIFMHDTPDKWMFARSVRTLSHGCLRVRNPMELAEIVLKEDKGWDKAKIAELDRDGPLNNEVPITERIPIHLVYFTAWVDGAGHLKSFADVYGHEKRVIQALDGEWDKIDHGKDHLAPVEPNFDPAAIASSYHQGQDPPKKNVSLGDVFGDPFGIGW